MHVHRLLQAVADPPQKTRGIGAVDNTVVVGQGERQNRTGLKRTVDHAGFHGRPADPQYRHLRPQHNGRKRHAADAALVGDTETAAVQFGGLDFFAAGSFGQIE